MATQDNTSNSVEFTSATDKIRGVASVERMMTKLWERTADSLTTEELTWFADSSEYAKLQARQLSYAIEGIGCLVSADSENNHGAGSFQNGDSISTLLFTIAHSVDTIAGMMEVSDSAQHRLANPELYHQLRQARIQTSEVSS